MSSEVHSGDMSLVAQRTSLPALADFGDSTLTESESRITC